MAEKKDTISWRWIWKCLSLHRLSMYTILILTLLIYLCGAAIPLCTQHAIDRIIRGDGYDVFIWLACIAVFSIIADIGLSNIRHNRIVSLGTLLDRRLSKRVLIHLLKSKLSDRRLNLGDILTSIQKTGRIRNFILQTVPQLLFDIGSALVSLLLLAYYDISIAFTVAVITFTAAWALNSRRSAFHASARNFQEVDAKRSGLLTEMVGSFYTIKAQSLEFSRLRQWVLHTNRFVESLKQYHLLGRRFGMTTQIVSRVINILVICMGGFKLGIHAITVGDLIAIQMLSSRIAAPMLNSSDIFRQFYEIKVAIDNLNSVFFLSSERGKIDYGSTNRLDSGFSVKNLAYSYEGTKEQTLKNINFSLPSNGVVAIVGRNGGGKTTLMRVLSGLFRNYSGEVFVGGRELRSYHPRWYRKHVGIVEQDAVLLTGDIRSNVAAGFDGLKDEEIQAALDFSGAAGFISKLKDGLLYQVSEGGRHFSGGQRQRLAISRAVVRKPKIIFLDEPTAFLDPGAGVDLEKKLSSLGRSSLVVMVSHHLLTTKQADLILVLDSGRLVSQGIHSDLVRNCQVYKGLWQNSTRIGEANHSVVSL